MRENIFVGLIRRKALITAWKLHESFRSWGSNWHFHNLAVKALLCVVRVDSICVVHLFCSLFLCLALWLSVFFSLSLSLNPHSPDWIVNLISFYRFIIQLCCKIQLIESSMEFYHLWMQPILRPVQAILYPCPLLHRVHNIKHCRPVDLYTHLCDLSPVGYDTHFEAL